MKNKDFVEIEYTGYLDDDTIFDTTDEFKAKEAGIFNPNMLYGPVIICLGERQLLEGLEEELLDKEINKDYQIKLEADKAFGKKDPKLLKIVSTSVFKKENINPMVGLQINIDGTYGVIKTVSGGRCVVDFNHPFASRAVKYDVKMLKQVTEPKDKIKGYLQLQLHLKDLEVEVKDKKAIVKGMKLPDEVKKELNDKLKDIVPEIQEIDYMMPEKDLNISKENKTV